MEDEEEKCKPIDVKSTDEISKERDENFNLDSNRRLSVSSILSQDVAPNAFSRATDVSDMRLIVESKPLYVSRLVLSIISPIFKEMFEKRAREMSIFEIPILGRKYDEMLEFLYCIYPDSLKPVSDENLAVLLKLSEDYKVQTLKNRCSQFMSRILDGDKNKSVSMDKLVWFMKLAEHYQMIDIHEKAMELATKTSSELLDL